MEQDTAVLTGQIRYLDLHNHPFFKPVFSTNFSPWDAIPAQGPVISQIIQSQANLRQISDNANSNLICVSLYAPELALVSQWLLKFAHLFTDAVDQAILNQMKISAFDYQKEIDEERRSIGRTPRNPKGVRPVKEISSFREYNPDDQTHLYVFYSVEGGHAFYGKNNTNGCIDEILNNLECFTTKSGCLVVYITPCHLTPNIFLTHAFGMKIFDDKSFIPVGYGLRAEGRLFLKKIIELKLHIDVKHMSLVSREQTYCEFKDKGPLICSHAGVTGFSWEERLNKRQKQKSLKEGPGFIRVKHDKHKSSYLCDTYFNPNSINLYDEDIVAILQSGGVIGISMDIRIIGGSRNLLGYLKLHEIEFVSCEEFKDWKDINRKFVDLNPDIDFETEYGVIKGDGGEEDKVIWDLEDRMEELEEFHHLHPNGIEKFFGELSEEMIDLLKKSRDKDRKDEHLRYWVNQIFHIVTIAENAGITDPWSRICLGSDYDGFISAVECSSNAGELGSFAIALEQQLPQLANEARISLPSGYTVKGLVEHIFFQNAFNFFNTHFC